MFEDSSPKVFFWQVIRIFDFLSLSNDSRYLQSEPLKALKLNTNINLKKADKRTTTVVLNIEDKIKKKVKPS